MTVVVPPTDDPQLSVLIVVYGGGALVIDAVDSLVRHTHVPFEVIIVDNASEDDSVAQISAHLQGVTLLRERVNLGFGQANNRAAEVARASVICILNPDARVTAGWLPPLLARIAASSVGAVGPALVNESGVIVETGAVVDHWGMTAPPGRRDFFGAIDERKTALVVDYLTGACVVMRTQVFSALGGFDVMYRLAYYEDVDLCFRLWQRELEVWCEPSSRVVHLGGGSADPAIAIELWHRNRSAFLLRWRSDLLLRPSFQDSDADLARLATWRRDHLKAPADKAHETMLGGFVIWSRRCLESLTDRARVALARWSP